MYGIANKRMRMFYYLIHTTYYNLNCHGRFDMRMRLVIFQLKIVKLK